MNDAIVTTHHAPLSTTLHAQTDARTDEQLVELWLYTGKRRSEHTRTAYRLNVDRFLLYVGKPLQQLKLEDLVDFQQELATNSDYDYAASTQRRILSGERHRPGRPHGAGTDDDHLVGVQKGVETDLQQRPAAQLD